MKGIIYKNKIFFIFTLILIMNTTLSNQGSFAEDNKENPLKDKWESASDLSVGTEANLKEVKEGDFVRDIIASNDEYAYASFGKADPFSPPLLSTHVSKVEIPIVSPLQRYRLHEIQVVGIWTLENKERKALVTTKNNEGFIVAIGDSVGKRGGKVVAIDPKFIKIREFTLAPDGTRQFEDFEIQLGKEGLAAEDSEETIVIESSQVKSSRAIEDEVINKKDELEYQDDIINPASDINIRENENEIEIEKNEVEESQEENRIDNLY